MSTPEPLYATLEQARDFIAGGSKKIFERHYRPHLTEHRRGGRLFFRYEEMRACAKKMEDGSFTETAEKGSGTSDSLTEGGGPTARRAQQYAQKLRSKPRASTPRLYPVSGGKAAKAGS